MNGYTGRLKRKTTDNKGFTIAGDPCFADTFVQGGSSVLRMKFSAKTPRHRKPPNVGRLFTKNSNPTKKIETEIKNRKDVYIKTN